LPFPARQLVAIARAVDQSARLLILDEPTSSLSPVEIEELFGVIRQTVGHGAAVLFISHRLPEVLAISDTVTVLRQGKVEATQPADELDEASVTRLMLGRALELGARSNGAQSASQPSWSLDAEVRRRSDSHRPSVPIQMRSGVTVGLLGLPGSGRDEIVHALIGRSPTLAAHCTVQGRDVAAGRLLGRAVGVVPADRHRAGIFPDLTVAENISLGPLTAPRKGIRARLFRSPGEERRLVESSIKSLSIHCRGPRQKLLTLSGGNQQKVVLSRVLAQGVPALVLDEPTQGIDVGSRAEIYVLLERLRAHGKAILVASQDAEELARLCSSISVIHEGQHVATFSAPFQTQELVRVASGGRTANGD
jgi:ABC-type sugar transport system ATPase subunit